MYTTVKSITVTSSEKYTFSCQIQIVDDIIKLDLCTVSHKISELDVIVEEIAEQSIAI